MIVRLDQGFVIPRFYGVAWIDCMRRQAVCLPMPLNVLAGLARNAWFWLRYEYRPKSMSVMDAYAQGFSDGRQDAAAKKN